MVGEFFVMPETWTRYWASFEHVVVGGVDYWELSLWVADENRDPVRILAGSQLLPSSTDGLWRSFWLEYNTSVNDVRAGRGDLVNYVRNIAMLRDPVDIPGILARPTR